MKYLFIDDDPTTNFYHKQLIDESGIAEDSKILNDSESSLDFLQACEPEELPVLIFLDIKMPKLDGFELLRELEESDSQIADLIDDIKIFVLTSSNMRRDREIAERFPNIVEFIQKPITAPQLLELIAKHT